MDRCSQRKRTFRVSNFSVTARRRSDRNSIRYDESKTATTVVHDSEWKLESDDCMRVTVSYCRRNSSIAFYLATRSRNNNITILVELVSANTGFDDSTATLLPKLRLPNTKPRNQISRDSIVVGCLAEIAWLNRGPLDVLYEVIFFRMQRVIGLHMFGHISM